MPSLFGSPEVDAFARSLAQELAERCDVADPRGGKDKRAQRRYGRTLESLYARARAFRTERGLGFYRKARLSNAFKWELKELGFRDDFVEEVTKGLVVSISRD